MKKLVIFILSVLLTIVGFGFSSGTALAEDGESNEVLMDVNQAPWNGIFLKMWIALAINYGRVTLALPFLFGL